MSYQVTIIPSLILSSLLLGCASNPPAPALSEAELQAQRDYTANLQQQDRNRDHAERMRRAKAIARAHKNGGVYYYSPYYRTSPELSDITVR